MHASYQEACIFFRHPIIGSFACYNAPMAPLTVSKPHKIDPYARLLQAVLCRAWQDAHGKDRRERVMALRWLRSDAAAVCDWLGLDAGTLRRRVVSDVVGHKKER